MAKKWAEVWTLFEKIRDLPFQDQADLNQAGIFKLGANAPIMPEFNSDKNGSNLGQKQGSAMESWFTCG